MVKNLLPMLETEIRSLIWEDPTCCRATKPGHHNYWACAPEPGSHSFGAHKLKLLKPTCPGARVPKQEMPPR